MLATNFDEFMIQFAICYILTWYIDSCGQSIMINPSQSYRWFFIHLFNNLIVIIFGFVDFIFCLNNPHSCFTSPWSSTMPFMICSASHIYHVIYFTNLKRDDYLHHILMGPIMGLLVIMFCSTSGSNMALLGFSGLPGGIDYLLLLLVNLRLIKKETEKLLNVYIHVWIRSPYIMFCMGIWYTNFVTEASSKLIGIGFMICYWNSQYFMHDTLSNYYTKLEGSNM